MHAAKWADRIRSARSRRKIGRAFEDIYEKFRWNSPDNSGESRSGEGSTLANTRLIRKALVDLLSALDVQTMLDASCGDWNWMKEIAHHLPAYTGLDVTRSVIQANRRRYRTESVNFIHTDSLSFLRKCGDKAFDLILLRHTLEHLPTAYNVPLLKEVRRCARHALVTSCKLYTEDTNRTTDFGGCKPINLLLAPYVELLGPPAREIDDHVAGEEDGVSYIYLYDFTG